MKNENRTMDYQTINEKVELISKQMRDIDQTLSDLLFFLPERKQEELRKSYREFGGGVVELRNEAEDYLRPNKFANTKNAALHETDTRIDGMERTNRFIHIASRRLAIKKGIPLVHLYLSGSSLKECGESIGVSTTRASQIMIRTERAALYAKSKYSSDDFHRLCILLSWPKQKSNMRVHKEKWIDILKHLDEELEKQSVGV